MHKTVSITIGGSLFNLEETGYRALDAYLQSVRAHFATYPDNEEIVSDIESRIAEEFSESLNARKKVITEKDVDALITRMGTVQDFEEFEATNTGAGKEEHPRQSFAAKMKGQRLFRDPDDQMIGGVCSGMAKYLGIDPTIVRLIFGITVLFGGAGVIVYILLWIILPEAKTASDKVEMTQGTVTLSAIQQKIEEKLPKEKRKSILRNIVAVPAAILRAVGKVIRVIVPVFGRILGAIVTIAAAFGVAALTIALVFMLTNTHLAVPDFPIRETLGNAAFYTLAFSGYFIALVPLLFIILGGSSLLAMRSAFSTAGVIGMTVLWFAAVSVFGATATSAAPAIEQAYTEAQKETVAKDIPVSAFQSLKVRGSYDVRIRKGATYTMRITGSQRAVDALHMEHMEDGTLFIFRKSTHHFCILCVRQEATIDLTVPAAVENLTAEASAHIDSDGINITGTQISATAGARIDLQNARLPQQLSVRSNAGARVNVGDDETTMQRLTIDSSAGSRVNFTGKTDTMIVDASAGSAISLQGSSATLTADLSAGARLDAPDFVTRDATIHVQAGARANVHVTGTLAGEANSAGVISYDGSPARVEVETNAGGQVRPAGKMVE